MLFTRRSLCLLCFALAFVSQSFGQKEGYIWYFGHEAGLDFNTGNPVPLTNSVMSTDEGCAAISDQNGNLLFYTDGIFVYNANHQQMPNGFGLLGDPSASQSGVVARVPGSLTRYYVFSVDDDHGPDGLHYSIVDLNAGGGLGDVILKNVPLFTPVTEKVTAVVHANGFDVWIIFHGWNNDAFHAYLLTPAGITGLVTSNVGVPHTGIPGNSRGCMKVSPDGTRLAVAVTFDNTVELFDFDDATGVVSNPINLNGVMGPFGVEFSRSSQRLYVSTAEIQPGDLWQFDLSQGTQAAIAASQTLVGHTASNWMGALQIGPDARIYCARMGGHHLGVVREPDSLGVLCDYLDNGVHLGGKSSRLGLPTFVQSYFDIPEVTFNFAVPCLGDSTRFFGQAGLNPDWWYWDFGDPPSGLANHSGQQNPSHLYGAAGTYTVVLVASKDSVRDTISFDVTVHDYPAVQLPNDTIICNDPTFTLDAGPNASYYIWNTNEFTQSITVSNTGLYWVEAGNGPCRVRDSIFVRFVIDPSVDLGPDEIYCGSQVVNLNALNPGATYLWSTGDTSQVIQPTSSGTYSVAVSAGICTVYDTVNLTFVPDPVADLGPDRSYCLNAFQLKGAYGGDVLWSTGDTGPVLTIFESGTYSATVTNSVCVRSDTVRIDLFEPVVLQLEDRFAWCPGEGPVQLTPQPLDAQYEWSTGATDLTVEIDQPGTYWVEATSADGCTARGEFEIYEDCEGRIFVPNAFTPNADGLNDVFGVTASNLQSFQLQIFDRWGRIVYQSQDPNGGWDGTFANQPQPEGVYVYKISYRVDSERPAGLEGSVHLLR